MGWDDISKWGHTNMSGCKGVEEGEERNEGEKEISLLRCSSAVTLDFGDT